MESFQLNLDEFELISRMNFLIVVGNTSAKEMCRQFGSGNGSRASHVIRL